MNLTFLRTLEGLRFPAMDSLMQAVTELGSEIVFLVKCGYNRAKRNDAQSL